MNLKVLKNSRGKDILVNADNITCVCTSLETDEECLIYFNGESDNCIGVKGRLIDVLGTLKK